MMTPHNMLLRISVLSFLLVSMILPGFDGYAQTGQTIVRPEPKQIEIGLGQVQTLSIVLENANNLYGIDVRGAFDPQIIEVQDMDASKDGVQMTPGTFPSPDFVVINATENITGTFQYVTTQINPSPPVSGNGVVLIFQLKGKKIGETTFTINFVQAADRNGNNLDITPQNGVIRVIQPGSQPTSTVNTAPIVIPASTNTPSRTATASPQVLVPTKTNTMMPAPTNTVASSSSSGGLIPSTFPSQMQPDATLAPTSVSAIPMEADTQQPAGVMTEALQTPGSNLSAETPAATASQGLRATKTKQPAGPIKSTAIAMSPSQSAPIVTPPSKRAWQPWVAVSAAGALLLVGVGGVLLVIVFFVLLKRSNPK